ARAGDVARQHVELAGGVLPDAEEVVPEPAPRPALEPHLLQAPQPLLARLGDEQRAVGRCEAAAEVAEDVAAAQLPHGAAAVHESTDHRNAEAAAWASGVAVLDDRLPQPVTGGDAALHALRAAGRRRRRVIVVEAVSPLAHVPAVVAAAP